MTEDTFTQPDGSADDWVDVRMTDPEEGEWDVDVVVAGGTVEYVDLRVRGDLFSEFVACLAEDVDEDRATAMLRAVAERKGLDLDSEES